MSGKVCRTCLEPELNEEFTEIDSNGNEISSKILLISGVQLSKEDEDCPAFICQTCLKELFQSLQFRRKCQNADEYFKAKSTKVAPKPKPAPEIVLEDEYPLKQEDKLSTDAMAAIEKPAHKSLQCRFCGIFLSRRNRRIEHERLHELDGSKKSFECFFCEKQISQKYALVPHFRKYHGLKIRKPERWKCAICVNKVLQAGKMALHYEKVHSDVIHEDISDAPAPISKIRDKKFVKAVKPPASFWPCSICGNSFSSATRYQTHLWNVHEITENQLISYRTPEELPPLKKSQKSSLNSTSSKLQTEKVTKFPCSTCGKIFASASTVRAHEKTHLDLEYQCDLCPSSFRVKAYLTAHVQKIHLKLKKFKCSFCNATFIHRELLNYHHRKHLRIRNFACRWCGKTFVTRNCCLVHERIHQNERPYSCKFCNQSFIHHSDHRRHELKHAEHEAKNATC